MSYPTRDYGEETAAAVQEPRLAIEVARTTEILAELRDVHHRLVDRLRHVTLERPKAVEDENAVPRESASKTVSQLRSANDGFKSEIAKIRDLFAHLEV